VCFSNPPHTATRKNVHILPNCYTKMGHANETLNVRYLKLMEKKEIPRGIVNCDLDCQFSSLVDASGESMVMVALWLSDAALDNASYRSRPRHETSISLYSSTHVKGGMPRWVGQPFCTSAMTNIPGSKHCRKLRRSLTVLDPGTLVSPMEFHRGLWKTLSHCLRRSGENNEEACMGNSILLLGGVEVGTLPTRHAYGSHTSANSIRLSDTSAWRKPWKSTRRSAKAWRWHCDHR